MIVEEMTVQGWKNYREPHTFRFGDGVNLLVGPNEAGKSVLLEALQRALFDRHTGISEEIKTIQPLGTSIAPEITVIFRVNGQRYRIWKRLLKDPRSELSVEERGTFQLQADGDDADREVLEMAGGTFPGKGPAQSKHRGLAEALWYLQMEPAVPEKTWNEGVQKGLGGVVQIAARTPLEQKVIDRVTQARDDYFTPTGRTKTESELARVRAHVQELEARVAALREARDRIRESREAMERLDAERQEKEDLLVRAQAEVRLAGEAVEASGVVLEKKVRIETNLQSARDRLDQLKKVRAGVSERNEALESLAAALPEQERNQRQKQAEAKVEQQVVERLRRQRKEAKEPELKQVEAELDSLSALERHHTLEKTILGLEQYLSRLHTAEKELGGKEKVLEQSNSPTAIEWGGYQQLSTLLKVAEGKAEASSIRVGIELRKKTSRVTADPEPHRADGEYLIVRPTTFDIDGVARIHVRGIGASLEELSAECDRLRGEATEVLRRFGVEDTDALAKAFASRQSLESEVKSLRKKVRDIKNENPEAPKELTDSKRGLDDEGAKLGNLPADARSWGGARIRSRIGELKRTKKETIQAVDELDRQERESTTRAERFLREAADLEVQLAEALARRDQQRAELAKVLQEYGSLTALDHVVTAAVGEVTRLEKASDGIAEEITERVTEPRERLTRAERAIKTLETRIAEIRREVTGHESRVEEIIRQAVYTSEGDAEAELGFLRSRLPILERRAAAIELLFSVLRECQENRTRALTQPIRELVGPWLRTLTGGRYDSVDLDNDLLPTALARTDGMPLPLSLLSYGTHEQIIVLVRLAMGVLASKDSKQVVVLDDRLVNADSVRAGRFLGILEDAGEKCQVLITTCNDGLYAGLNSLVVRIPESGKTGVGERAPETTSGSAQDFFGSG
jgi:DNA repair protein SbcC/Rad50